MNWTLIKEAGIGVFVFIILIYLFVKHVLPLIKGEQKSNGNISDKTIQVFLSKITELIDTMKQELQPCKDGIKRTVDMLSKTDDEGVLKIYRRPSIDQAVLDIAKFMGQMTEILRNQELEKKKYNDDMKLIKKKFDIG